MSDTEKIIDAPTCPFVFKKRTIKGRNSRRAQSSTSNIKEAKNNSSDSDNEDNAIVIRPNKKKAKLNPNIQQSKGLEKKQHRTTINDSDSNNDDDDKVLVSYKSKKSAMAEGSTDQRATATLEIETEKDRDAQAIFEKRLEINEELKGKEEDNVYRGLNNYTQYYKPKDTAAGNASSGMVRKGPIRAPSNLRATVRWDYQPDICKDYKETGFCGFGDSCKFLHDRSDYKHGWQLEREWQEGKYGADSDDDKKYEIDSDEELPFKCVICKLSFTDPIVTKCKHYFCEKCALARYKKTIRCFVCDANVTTFNPARNLISKLKGIEKSTIKKEENSEESVSD